MKKRMIRSLITLLVFMLLLCTAAGCSDASEHTAASDEPGSGGDNKPGKHTVTFFLNYAGAEKTEVEVDDGTAVSEPAAPERENYRFGGWVTGSRSVILYDFSSPITDDLQVYARWIQDTAPVTVTFHYNYPDASASEPVTREIAAGERIEPEEAPSFDRYSFEGWCTDALGTAPFDFTKGISRNMSLYAHWRQTVFVISFDLMYDGSLKPVETDARTGAAELPVPVRDGYRFGGWYKDNEYSNRFEEGEPILTDLTLYAAWELSAVTVSFDLNYDGANLLPETKVELGEKVIAPEEVTRYGYEFDAWYRDAALTQEYDFSDLVDASGERIRLYAGWRPKTVPIVYEMNGGTLTNPQESAVFGEPLEGIGTPEKANSTFLGWYTDEALTEQFTQNAPIESEVLTLYARWLTEEAEGVQVTFRYKDGSGNDVVLETQNIDIGEKAERPEDPVRTVVDADRAGMKYVTGFEFAGWYKDEACKKTFDFGTIITEDTAVYAKWINTFTFEAEETDVRGKEGFGTSTNSPEYGMIYGEGKFDNGSEIRSSNGYWLEDLYAPGLSFDYHIVSDRDMEDAKLVLRLSVAYYDMKLGPLDWLIQVGYIDETGEFVGYNDLFPMYPGIVMYETLDLSGAFPFDEMYGERNHRPFEDYTITSELPLYKGDNVIRFTTNNMRSHGGTFYAEAPLFDCLYITADGVLSWDEDYHFPDNVNNENVRKSN